MLQQNSRLQNASRLIGLNLLTSHLTQGQNLRWSGFNNVYHFEVSWSFTSAQNGLHHHCLTNAGGEYSCLSDQPRQMLMPGLNEAYRLKRHGVQLVL